MTVQETFEKVFDELKDPTTEGIRQIRYDAIMGRCQFHVARSKSGKFLMAHSIGISHPCLVARYDSFPFSEDEEVRRGSMLYCYGYGTFHVDSIGVEIHSFEDALRVTEPFFNAVAEVVIALQNLLPVKAALTR